jgi:hypothetical protein
MKWFWFSLIGFCILMCSCKTKKLDSHVKVKSEVHSDFAILNESVKISTKNHAYFANEAQNIVIEEVIIATEYDKETGKAVKETKTTRKIAQDTDKVVAEEEGQSVTDCNQLEVEQSVEEETEEDLEVKEESVGAQESFGKWFGIGISCVIALLLIYLLKKLRIN